MPDTPKFYRWLMRLYPARFREEYQPPMERQFQDEYRETDGRSGVAGLWLRTLCDVSGSAPREMAHELIQDLRYSARVYRGRWLSATLAVAALGLAIGMSTAVFSVMNALLLRGLPFSEPSQLVELWKASVGVPAGHEAFQEWARKSAYLQEAAAFSASEMNLTGTRGAWRVKVAETSANFFRLLGTKAVVGRTFARNEDAFGKSGVAVISYRLWQQWFGGAPDVLGASLELNGRVVTVIGVAPPRFDYPGNASVWTPTAFDFEQLPKLGAFLFETIGRLKPGVSLRQAQELFDAEVQQRDPQSLRADELNRARLVSLRDQLAGSVRAASWVLAGLILLVFLAACANVAQLLLSRTTERRQELAVRAALGASRGRLIQQLTTEAMTLTAAAAVLGLFVARWAVQAAAAVAPAQLAAQAYTILDWRVLGFAAALALLTGIVFGVLPAWLIGRLQPSERTMRIGAGRADHGTRRVRAALLALQAGLTLILVTGSITMGRAFLKLLDTDLGLHPRNVVTMSVSLQGTRYRGGAAQWQYYSEVLDRLRAVPGVTAAGAVSYLPLASNIYMANAFQLDSGQTVPRIVMNAATPGYFRAIGTALLAGLDFEAAERGRLEPAVIVNDAFARAAGMGTEIVGRSVKASWSKTPYRIVGVVATTKLGGPVDPGSPQIYWPVEEEPPETLTFVARVAGKAEAMLTPCGDAIRAVDPNVPVYDVKTINQRLADVLARPRFYTTAIAFLAALAISLAGVGSYGAAAYSVAQRQHEMGVRIALGASHGRIRRMAVREILAPMVCGMAAGIVGAGAMSRYLEHLVVGARAADLWTCGAAGVCLLVGGFVAVWRATGKVLGIEAGEALRAE
ncbi:MAG TPA: ADOP family duplicated permease [Bryobacteraceae bacterium]|nr:ADOP family duplicated permease [Bryobacteraceae bacterium]